MTTHSRSSSARPAQLLAIVVLAGVIAALAVYRLRDYPYPLSIGAALKGAATTAPDAVPALLRTWLILGVMLAAAARWLRGRDPDWSAGERIAGALVLWWSGAYVCLLTLGPLGLYRTVVLRLLVAATVGVALWTARAPAPRATRGSSPGVWIFALAVALSVGPLLLLQIGSPISPFMDILGYIPPIQKIVTFQFYDPYANDAAGLWAPTRQVVGFDAGFSFLALVAGLRAHFAMSSLIVPFAVLQLGALYLLARVTSGKTAGGLAALFLLQTFLWRRTPDIRSTGIAFPLIAIGLAFLLHARRDGWRAAVGALALGLSVTVSPLIGGLGMQVAAVTAFCEWVDGGRPLWTPVLALAGASLLAMPQVLIGMSVSVPLFCMPLCVAAGLVLLAVVARFGPDVPRATGRRRLVGLAACAILPFTVLYLNATRTSGIYIDDFFGYPVLTFLGLAGLVATAVELMRGRGMPAAAVPAFALWLGMLEHTIAAPLRFTGSLETRSLASEVTTKIIYYWAPYWFALGAGTWFAALAHRWSLVGTLAIVLALVVYPIRAVPEALDYDTQQLSVAETWGFQLANTARGYHAGRPDRRWVLDTQWRELANILMQERAAGRIDYRTHVLQIVPAIDSVELALWTGISVDLITPQYDPQSIWNGNGRARAMDALPAAFAARPPYVIVEGFRPEQFAAELASYDQLLSRPLVKLYRRRD